MVFMCTHIYIYIYITVRDFPLHVSLYHMDDLNISSKCVKTAFIPTTNKVSFHGPIHIFYHSIERVCAFENRPSSIHDVDRQEQHSNSKKSALMNPTYSSTHLFSEFEHESGLQCDVFTDISIDRSNIYIYRLYRCICRYIDRSI